MCCVILLVLHMTNVFSYPDKDDGEDSDLGPRKKILLWNGDWSDAYTFGTGHQAFVDAQCPVSNCEIVRNGSDSEDSELLRTFDALLVNVHQLWMTPDWLTALPAYPKQRKARIVYFSRESASYTYTGAEELPGSYFNWSMTYQHDADVPFPYGRVAALATNYSTTQLAEMKDQWLAEVQLKSQTIVWIVNKCQTMSRREAYVDQLRQYIDVDICGRCGDSVCDYNKMADRYKFYLAFEDSLCDDYVTEGFYEALDSHVVPVVLGGANYSQMAPNHSFVDATYRTPEELADVLRQLDGDDEAYVEYFAWKADYRVETGVAAMARRAFCDLCAKLHEDVTPKTYASMVESMGSENQCRHNHLPWFENTNGSVDTGSKYT